MADKVVCAVWKCAIPKTNSLAAAPGQTCPLYLALSNLNRNLAHVTCYTHTTISHLMPVIALRMLLFVTHAHSEPTMCDAASCAESLGHQQAPFLWLPFDLAKSTTTRTSALRPACLSLIFCKCVCNVWALRETSAVVL